MFRHTLMLLMTTVLGSLAFSGYDGGDDEDIDTINRYYDMVRTRPPFYEDPLRYDYLVRPEYARAQARAILYGGPTHGIDKLKSEIDEDTRNDDPIYDDPYDTQSPDSCEDKHSEEFVIAPWVEPIDDSDDKRRQRVRPYFMHRANGNNINSNTNNNIMGHRYRRFPNSMPYRPMPFKGPWKYPNGNRNLPGVRRSNMNSNVNSNDIHYEKPQNRVRTEFMPYDWPQAFGSTNPNYAKLKLDKNSQDSASQNKYGDWPYRIVNGPTTPYYLDIRDGKDANEEKIPPTDLQSDNVNVNSNMNILARRSNTNANKNSNILSRNRRSTNEASNETVPKQDNVSTSTIGNFESTTKNGILEEKRDNPRGVFPHGIN